MPMTKIMNKVSQVLERRRKFRAALAYNRDHTFSYNGPHAHTWMCPICCRVQRAHSSSKFFGPQFDACCGLPCGGRGERRFAMPYSVI